MVHSYIRDNIGAIEPSFNSLRCGSYKERKPSPRGPLMMLWSQHVRSALKLMELESASFPIQALLGELHEIVRLACDEQATSDKNFQRVAALSRSSMLWRHQELHPSSCSVQTRGWISFKTLLRLRQWPTSNRRIPSSSSAKPGRLRQLLRKCGWQRAVSNYKLGSGPLCGCPCHEGTILFGVSIRTPDFWKLPNVDSQLFLQARQAARKRERERETHTHTHTPARARARARAQQLRTHQS